MRKHLIVGLIVCICLLIIETIIIFNLASTSFAVKEQVEDLFFYQNIIKISEDPIIYVCRKESAVTDFKNFMTKNGWNEVENEQLGSGYLFEKEGSNVLYILVYEANIAKWTLEK